MSYIITDDKHYKNIAKSLRSKMQTDREYYPKDMAIAIDNIPSSADGTDEPIGGIYLLNPDENGKPTEIKVIGLKNDTSPVSTILTSNNIKNSVKKITFVNCSINKINDKDFANLTNLEEFFVPDGVTYIGWHAFSGCEHLKKIVIPEGITQINQGTFNKCGMLEELYIPKGVTSINYQSIVNCYSLKTIFFPNSLTVTHTYFSLGLNVSFDNPILEDGFNCNNFPLAVSSLYSRETILKCLNALADRTGQTAYKLQIGATNLAKLTEEDILIATNKNWTLA